MRAGLGSAAETKDGGGHKLMLKWLFIRQHKKAIRILRSSIDTLLERRRDQPQEFEDCALCFPVVLASLREKSKRPVDVILEPDDLTFRQREELIRLIDTESKRTADTMQTDPQNYGALCTAICLNWMEILHQCYFRAADMPDILPDETASVRRDMKEFVYHALEIGTQRMSDLDAAPKKDEVLH